jgi:hypothetical protein
VDLRGQQRAKGGYEERAHTGEFWRCALIESETRLRAARGIAKSETEAAIEAFEQLKSSLEDTRILRRHRYRMGGADTTKRWSRCGGRCRSTEGGDGGPHQEAAPSGLAVPTDGLKQRENGRVW